jgi:hypothetical protein
MKKERFTMSHTTPPNWSDPSACVPFSQEERCAHAKYLAWQAIEDARSIAWLLWSIREDMRQEGISPTIAAFYTRERS